MPASQQDALSFVNTHCGSKKLAAYRDYAVTDFLQYYNVKDIAAQISVAEMQKSWALFSKWHDRSDPGAGAAYPKSVDFFYTEGANKTTAPTNNVDKAAKGAKAAQLKGFGQCNYFAEMTYALLKKPAVGKMAGKGPLVEKISTPGHNWVIVNRDAPKADWVVVDLWLYALGVPFDKCVCLAKNAAIPFYEMSIKLILKWDSNTSKETNK